MKRLYVLAFAALFVFAAAERLWAAETDQPPAFTRHELREFVRDWPDYCRYFGTKAHDFEDYQSPGAWRTPAPVPEVRLLANMGWSEPRRFFYILNHIIVGLGGLDAVPTPLTAAGPLSGASRLESGESVFNGRDPISRMNDRVDRKWSDREDRMGKKDSRLGRPSRLKGRGGFLGSRTNPLNPPPPEEPVPPQAEKQDRYPDCELPAAECELVDRHRDLLIQTLSYVPGFGPATRY